MTLPLQGLLRELFKAQGYSVTGSVEWDWTKYEAQPGSVDVECRDLVITGGRDGSEPMAAGVEDLQGSTTWQPTTRDMKGSTRKHVSVS